ncbi:MAG: hypothetical protein KDA65_09610, partial [Planctomycetaceae bacterium]|nr:hypothetical protein [Planctomycetaceae bacterium]
MSRISSSMKLTAAFVSLLLIAGGIFLLTRRAEAADKEAISQLEKMSHSEKIQVRKNMEYFQSLSSGEQTALRTMHEEIQGSAALRKTYRIYCDWLKTLTAWQRQELASVENVQERMALVNRFLEENREQEKQKTLFDQLRKEEETNQQEAAARLEQSPNQIANILEPVRQKLAEEPGIEDSLKSLDQQGQNTRVLLLALQREFRKTDPQEPLPEVFLTKELVDEMMRRIPGERGRWWSENFPSPDRKFGMIYYLQQQLEKYYAEYVHKGEDPPLQVLEEVFYKLDEEVQSQISPTSQSNDRIKRLLKKYWLNPDLGEIERILSSQRKREFRN